MNTPIIDRNVIKEPPQSPRERISGFAIAERTLDKSRARLAQNLGE